VALRKSNQYESAYGTTALTLVADEDESILVRGMYSRGASTAHMQVTVGQRTVADYRVAGSLGNHLCFPIGAAVAGPSLEGNLFDLSMARGWHRGIPVPSGHTMTWTGPNAAASVNSVLYDTYDAGDISRDMPNGPESNELDYVVYGNTGATIATAATFAFDTSVSPTEFDAFPFDVDVPGRTQITVYGILGSTFSPSENDGTDQVGTTRFKATRNQTVLWDKDRVGLPFEVPLAAQSADAIGTGASPIGNYSDTDRRLPLIFPEPMIFEAGEELTFEVTAAVAGTPTDILIADQEIGLICRAVRS